MSFMRPAASAHVSLRMSHSRTDTGSVYPWIKTSSPCFNLNLAAFVNFHLPVDALRDFQDMCPDAASVYTRAGLIFSDRLMLSSFISGILDSWRKLFHSSYDALGKLLASFAAGVSLRFSASVFVFAYRFAKLTVSVHLIYYAGQIGITIGLHFWAPHGIFSIWITLFNLKKFVSYIQNVNSHFRLLHWMFSLLSEFIQFFTLILFDGDQFILILVAGPSANYLIFSMCKWSYFHQGLLLFFIWKSPYTSAL